MGRQTITFRHDIGGTLTDLDAVPVLSDATGTYGVKRNDTDAVVVDDGTEMTRASEGVYVHTFDEPADDLTYTAYVEWVYGGTTYRQQKTPVSDTSAQALADAALAGLAAMQPGVSSVSVDGESVSYNIDAEIRRNQYLDRKAAIAAGTRPRAARVDLSGF